VGKFKLQSLIARPKRELKGRFNKGKAEDIPTSFPLPGKGTTKSQLPNSLFFFLFFWPRSVLTFVGLAGDL